MCEPYERLSESNARVPVVAVAATPLKRLLNSTSRLLADITGELMHFARCKMKSYTEHI